MITLYICGYMWEFQKTARKTLSARPKGVQDWWLSDPVFVSEWDSMMSLMAEVRGMFDNPRTAVILEKEFGITAAE
jgi:hypothetical protein